MKKLSFLLFVLTFVIASQALIVETGSLKDFLYGADSSFEYDNFVSHISEGIASPNYNYYAPFDPQTTGFGDFVTPNTTQLDNWSSITEEFLNGNWETAQNMLTNNNYPYHVVEFHDTDFDRTYYMLRETLNTDTDNNIDSDPDDDVTGSFDYGWGLYIYNPEAANPIIVTVPHPTDDFPTIVLGYHTFTKWDSAFLMVSGAGREVKWTNVPPYYNSKSISDPTRNINHPFNRSYQKFADYIRDDYGRLEFSAQMHSYDWNDRHNGYANTQISAGATRPNPNLPIWDHSNSGQDLLNWSDEIIFPANTFGVHKEVDRNEYYAIFNTVHELNYDNNPETPINTNVDLWGYSENRQMQYTLSGTTDYDVVDPFFHIEIDELPEVYDQTIANYWWFYGYDPTLGKFIPENIYTMTENYYTYWIDRIAENIDTFIGIDNDSANPPMPTNFQTVAANYNDVILSWDPVSDHNFKSYQILYSDSPIVGLNYQVFDRENNQLLADQKTDNIKVTGLTPDTDYYFQIRTVDYSDNYSAAHEEIEGYTTPFKVQSLTAKAEDPYIIIEWKTTNESNLSLYKVYRRELGDETWEQASESIIANNQTSLNTYTWYDETAQYGHYYEYKIKIYNMAGSVYQYDVIVQAQFSDFITLIASNDDGSVSDQVIFGVNQDASDGYESSYDVTTSTSGSGTYVLAAFYEQYYNSSYRYLEKNIYGDTDLTQNYKTYVLQVKSSLSNQQLKISLDDFATDRFSRKVWLKESNNNFIDLTQEPLYFTVSNSNFKTFTLYYGNLNPSLTFANTPAFKIHHPNSIINLQWSYQNNEMLDHYRLDLISATDSLNIESSVAANTYFFPWLIPLDAHIEDAKFVITAFANDGEVRRFESSWTMGILPTEMTYNFQEGWQLVSHVWENDAPTANELFGTGTSLVQFMPNQNYEPTLFYNFGNGYWANLPQAIETTNSGDIYNDQVTIDIHQGWNLIGNPYPSDTDLSSLIFDVDGTEYTIGEMITYEYISRGIYVHRENGYELTDTVKGMEGFYLYSALGDFNGVTLTFTPYRHHYGLETLPVSWSALVIAETANDKDNILVGFSDYASDDIDYNLDFPKAPNKPYEGIDIYTNYATDDSYNQGQQDYKAPVSEDEVKEWNFLVNVRSLEPITLSFESEDFPFGSLFTALEVNGNDFYFDTDHDYEFTPTELGEHQFKLKIANYALDNENGDASPIASYFNVYPNPFNPETTIAFDLKHEGKVELSVYNLRGQKVKTLCNETLPAGRKTFVWNGKNSSGKQTASGIYFMKLNAQGQKSKIRKVMLMK